VLRWLRHRTDLHTLAADTHVSEATAYRYLHEALDVIAVHAPDLHQVVAAAHAGGAAYLCLDATLVPTDRVAARADAGHDLWYSGKHRRHGGNVAVLSDPGGFPLWVSDVRPSSIHDLTTARELVLPALYPHAARGCRGWPTRIHRRRRRHPRPDHAFTRGPATHQQPLLQPVDHRAAGAHRARKRPARPLARPRPGHPLPAAHRNNRRWRALDRVTLCPQRIGTIAAAALVLTSLDRGSR